jgi:hypothetical protein
VGQVLLRIDTEKLQAQVFQSQSTLESCEARLIEAQVTVVEMRTGKPVCVVGATVSKELFGTQDAMGNKLCRKNVSCEVVGQLEAKGH